MGWVDHQRKGVIDGKIRDNIDEREGTGDAGGFRACEAKGDNDRGGNAAFENKLPAMLAAVQAI